MAGDCTLDEFLAPISAALGREVPLDVPAGVHDTSRGLERETWSRLTRSELADIFEREGAAVGLEVARCSADGVADAVCKLAGGWDVQSAVFGDDPLADEYGIPAALAAAGVDAQRFDASAGRAAVDMAAAADLGVAFPFAGIARTATVALRTDGGSGRSVALLPPDSVAVLPVKRLVPQMIDVLEALEEEGAGGGAFPSSVVFATGPSATSDIELVRVVGVHGPVASAVVLVEEG